MSVAGFQQSKSCYTLILILTVGTQNKWVTVRERQCLPSQLFLFTGIKH